MFWLFFFEALWFFIGGFCSSIATKFPEEGDWWSLGGIRRAASVACGIFLCFGIIQFIVCIIEVGKAAAGWEGLYVVTWTIPAIAIIGAVIAGNRVCERF